MPTDAEITFADHMGRFYARRFSFPPMVGRLIGYLAVCDPPDPTIGELAEALLASRSAIAGAVNVLETIHVAHRSRVAGERMDRVRIDLSTQQSMGLDVSEYEEMRKLAREGLEVLGDAPGMSRWRKHLFLATSHLTADATEYFKPERNRRKAETEIT